MKDGVSLLADVNIEVQVFLPHCVSGAAKWSLLKVPYALFIAIFYKSTF